VKRLLVEQVRPGSVDERLFLMIALERNGAVDRGGHYFTQDHLASLCGVSKKTIQRALDRLEKLGLIVTDRRQGQERFPAWVGPEATLTSELRNASEEWREARARRSTSDTTVSERSDRSMSDVSRELSGVSSDENALVKPALDGRDLAPVRSLRNVDPETTSSLQTDSSLTLESVTEVSIELRAGALALKQPKEMAG
jgi:DNA-binding transcriptional MocR family regulator